MSDTYTLKLNDDRTLAYACYGRADGKPLYFMHGFPGSRYQAALIYEQAKEALINSTNVMKGETHGTQQPRHINLIGEGVSTPQRSNSLVQSINQRFPKSASVSVVAPERPGFGKTTLLPRRKDGHLSVLVNSAAEDFSDFVASASN